MVVEGTGDNFGNRAAIVEVGENWRLQASVFRERDEDPCAGWQEPMPIAIRAWSIPESRADRVEEVSSAHVD